jgi:hypothetical protein
MGATLNLDVPTTAEIIHPDLASIDYDEGVEKAARVVYYKVAEHENLTGPHKDHEPWETAPVMVREMYRALARVTIDTYLGREVPWRIPPPGHPKKRKRRRAAKPVPA